MNAKTSDRHKKRIEIYDQSTGEPRKPATIQPLEVKVEDSFDEAYREFKLTFQKERIIGRLKERQFYEKPSDKRRRKKREAIERRLQAEMREKLIQSGEWEKRQKKKEAKRLKKMQERQKTEKSDDELI